MLRALPGATEARIAAVQRWRSNPDTEQPDLSFALDYIEPPRPIYRIRTTTGERDKATEIVVQFDRGGQAEVLECSDVSIGLR